MYNKIILLLSLVFSIHSLKSQTAEVQVIHNSPDISIKEVDIWINNQPAVDSLYFRTATPYVELPAGSPLVVSVMPPSVNDTSLALHTETLSLMADSSYVVIASGFIDNALYDSIRPFRLATMRTHREARQSGNTDVLVYHGAPEEKPVQVDEMTVPVPNLIDSLWYDEFEYLELATADYELDVINTFTRRSIIQYEAPLSSLGLMDSSIVVLASGFLDSLKSITSDTSLTPVPVFGLYVALPTGGDLIELPIISGIGLDEFSAAELKLYPNPTTELLNIEFQEEAELKSAELYSLNGRLVETYQPKKKGNYYQLNLIDAGAGTYLLKLQLEDGRSTTRKLILR